MARAERAVLRLRLFAKRIGRAAGAVVSPEGNDHPIACTRVLAKLRGHVLSHCAAVPAHNEGRVLRELVAAGLGAERIMPAAVVNTGGRVGMYVNATHRIAHVRRLLWETASE